MPSLTRRGLIAAGIGLPLAAPAIAQSALRTVTLAQAGDGLHLIAFHVAVEAGMFEKQGLKLDWIDVGSGPRSTAALMGGSAELSIIGLFEVIRSAGEGAGLVAISTGYDTYPQTLVLTNAAVARAGITAAMGIDERVKRLQGMTIGITSPGSTTDGLIRSILVARGYDPDRYVTLQPLGGSAAMYSAFQKNVIDGFVWTAPEPLLIEKAHTGMVLVDPLRELPPEFQGVVFSVLATSANAIKTKPEQLAGTLRAVTEAMKLVQSDPDKARALVRKSFAKVDEQVFNLSFDEYVRGVPKSPLITPEEVTRTTTWRKAIDKTLKEQPFSAVVDMRFAEAALKG